MTPQPKQFSYEYASIFQDASVVAAYPHRAPYPAETFTILAELIDKTVSPCRILDAGCGTGQMTAGLLPYTDSIDAVDISTAMITAGKQMPYGTDPKINWITGGVETITLQPPYALIVAAASFHWMRWAETLPRFARLLSPNGYLAIVEKEPAPTACGAESGPIFARFSMNQDYQSYDMLTIAQDLQSNGLFRLVGLQETRPMVFRQSIDAWIEAVHASNGFSRDRMSATNAAAFDQQVRQLLFKYYPSGEVEQMIYAKVVYGKPLDPKIEVSE